MGNRENAALMLALRHIARSMWTSQEHVSELRRSKELVKLESVSSPLDTPTYSPSCGGCKVECASACPARPLIRKLVTAFILASGLIALDSIGDPSEAITPLLGVKVFDDDAYECAMAGISDPTELCTPLNLIPYRRLGHPIARAQTGLITDRIGESEFAPKRR